MFITVTNCSLQQRVKRVCRILCTGMPEGGSMTGAFHPLVLSKREQRGRRGLFIRNRQIFEVAKGIARVSLNFPKEFFVQLLPTNSLPQRSSRPFLMWSPVKVFMCFSANLGRHFFKLSKVGRHFYSDFQDVAQILSKSKLLGMRLHSLHPHL